MTKKITNPSIKQNVHFSVAKGNPGVRATARAQGEVDNKDKDEPWTSNYTELHDWLVNNEARCDWQLRYGKGRHGFMLEQWRMPRSLPFIVQVHAGGSGWDIFTPIASININETLDDAKARAYPRSRLPIRFVTPEGASTEALQDFARRVRELADRAGIAVEIGSIP